MHTKNQKKIILREPLCFTVLSKTNAVKIKKMEACTHLSKLSNSSQFAEGMYCPGVAHKIKMINAQMNANNKDRL